VLSDVVFAIGYDLVFTALRDPNVTIEDLRRRLMLACRQGLPTEERWNTTWVPFDKVLSTERLEVLRKCMSRSQKQFQAVNAVFIDPPIASGKGARTGSKGARSRSKGDAPGSKGASPEPAELWKPYVDAKKKKEEEAAARSRSRTTKTEAANPQPVPMEEGRPMGRWRPKEQSPGAAKGGADLTGRETGKGLSDPPRSGDVGQKAAGKGLMDPPRGGKPAGKGLMDPPRKEESKHRSRSERKEKKGDGADRGPGKKPEEVGPTPAESVSRTRRTERPSDRGAPHGARDTAVSRGSRPGDSRSPSVWT
jgi:hypothetical protein